MLRPDAPGIERVYLHRTPVDMRRQIDGLSLLAKEVMRLDPMSAALFAFINVRRNAEDARRTTGSAPQLQLHAVEPVMRRGRVLAKVVPVPQDLRFYVLSV